jgi:hypothetical protein
LGCEVAFLVGGSLATGMAVEGSDVDLFYAAVKGSFYDLFGENEGRFFYTEPKDVIVSTFRKKLVDAPKLEVLEDECNLTSVGETLERVQGVGSLTRDSQELWALARLYAAHHTNTAISNRIEPFIIQIDQIREKCPYLDLVLEEHVSSDLFPHPGWRELWQKSFAKYHDRLGERRIGVPTIQIERENEFVSYLISTN